MPCFRMFSSDALEVVRVVSKSCEVHMLKSYKFRTLLVFSIAFRTDVDSSSLPSYTLEPLLFEMHLPMHFTALALAALGLVDEAAAAPPINPILNLLCNAKPYSSYLPLSSLPTALSYCSSSFPLRTPSVTVTSSVTSTSTVFRTTQAAQPEITTVQVGELQTTTTWWALYQ